MAGRFRRFGGRMRQGYRRWGNRQGMRYAFRRGGRARGIAGIGIKYVAGAALGYIAPRVHPMQDLAITAAAVLPIRLPYGIKGIAQGYVMGMIVKNFLPSIGGFSGSQDNFTV